MHIGSMLDKKKFRVATEVFVENSPDCPRIPQNQDFIAPPTFKESTCKGDQRSKAMKLLSDAALLEAAQVKEVSEKAKKC
ncbi:hypothetical protein Tco_0256728 [Tanacetum coccineum]